MANTHRVVAMLRRRATTGPSFLRITLAPLTGADQTIVVSVVLMRSQRPAVPPPSPALLTDLAAERTARQDLGLAV